jgi:replicative DNA helicase
MIQSNAQGLRLPPQHQESEKALLGSILLRSDVLYELIDIFPRNAFYSERHRIIYEAMLDLHTRHEPVDLVTLAAKLEDRKQLETIGGRAYLAELANSVPSSANAKFYAETVRRKHLMRSLIDAAERISEISYNEDAELETLLDEAERRIFEITNTGVRQSIVHIKSALEEAWERIDRLHHTRDGLRGVPTGFSGIDALLSGLQKTDLIILAARPSVGKTSLALDIARRAAVNYGVPVGIFSLEMSTQQLIDRMISAQSAVNAWKLRTGKGLQDSDFSYLRDAIDSLSKAPIFINDTPGLNILSMRSAVRKMKSEHNLGLVVVDYLQLMTPLRNSDSMVQQVTEISRSLKSLAKELDIPVLALSQLSRAVEQRGGKPRLSDLRDSGSIEQDADVVMFIHRDDKTNENSERPNIAEILIEKHRNGPTGRVELFFDSERSTFRDIEKNRAIEDAFENVF